MKSLDEAWLWYETVRTQLHLIGLLGRRYWDNLPWDGPLGREEKFKGVEGTSLNSRSSFSLEHLDDLAVLVLLSVFESVVRELVLAEVRDERRKLVHSQVIRIVDDALDGIENGSFGRLMEAFKGRTRVSSKRSIRFVVTGTGSPTAGDRRGLSRSTPKPRSTASTGSCTA